MGKDSKTWKAKCIESHDSWMPGDVVGVVNGVMLYSENHGWGGSKGEEVKTFDNWRNFHSDSKWELIEDEKETSVSDAINPNHYKSQCSLECIDAMLMAFGVDDVYKYCVITAWKYMWRYENKNGIEDIKKARWFTDKAKELIPEYLEWQNIDFILRKIEDKML
jgi:hypothetical protein